jgi:hypothetical protein
VFLGSFGLSYYNISVGYDNTQGTPTVNASFVGSNPLAIQSNFGYRCAVFGKLAYITTNGSTTIQLLDLETNNTPTIIYTHSHNLFGIAYADGKLLTSCALNELLVFDVNPNDGNLITPPQTSDQGTTFYDLVFDGQFVWGQSQGSVRIWDPAGTTVQTWGLINAVAANARIAPDGIGGAYVAGGRLDLPNSGALYRFVPEHPGPVLDLPYPSDTNSEGMGVAVTDNGDVAVACTIAGYQFTGGGSLYNINLAAQDASFSDIHHSFDDLGNITSFPGTQGTYTANMPSSFNGGPTAAGTNLTRFWVEITVNSPTGGNNQFLLEGLVNGSPVVSAPFVEPGTGTFYVELIAPDTFVQVAGGEAIELRIGENPPALGTSIDWSVRFGVVFDYSTQPLTNQQFTSSPVGPFGLSLPNISNRSGYTLTRARLTITVNSVSGALNPFEINVYVNGNFTNQVLFSDTSTGTFDFEFPITTRVPTPLQANTLEFQINNPSDDPIAIDWNVSLVTMYRTAGVLIANGSPPGGTLTYVNFDYEARQNNPYGTSLDIQMFVDGNFVTSTFATEVAAPDANTLTLTPNYSFKNGQEYNVIVYPPVGGEHFLMWHHIRSVSNFDASVVAVHSYRSMARDDKAVGDFQRLLLALPDGTLRVSNGRVTTSTAGTGGPNFPGETHGDLAFRGVSVWGRLPAGTSEQVLRTQGPGADPVWASQLVFPSEAAGDITARGTNAWVRIPAGTQGTVLKTNGSGSLPQWLWEFEPIINVTEMSYTVQPGDRTIVCNNNSGVTVTLPTNPSIGEWYRIKNVATATTSQVTVSTGSNNVDNYGVVSNHTLIAPKSSQTFVCTSSSNWTLFDFAANGSATNLFFVDEAQGDLVYRTNKSWTRLPAGTLGQVLKTNGPGQDPQWASVGLSFEGEAQGDLAYRNATTWTRLPAGTPGQFLRTNGEGADPSWATVNGGGAADNGIANRLKFQQQRGQLGAPQTVGAVNTSAGLPSTCQSLSSDGVFLATISTADSNLRLIDHLTGTVVSTVAFTGTPVQVIALGQIHGSTNRRFVVNTSNLGPVFITTTAAGARVSTSIPVDTCKAMYFDGTHLWIAGGTNQIRRYNNVLSTSLDSITASNITSSNTVFCSNTNGFSNCMVFDGTFFWVIDQRASGGTNSLYKIDPTKGTVTTINGFAATEDWRCITFDGRYLWLGGVSNTTTPTIRQIDPSTAVAGTPGGSNITIGNTPIPTCGSNTPIDSIVFDGTRIIVSTSGVTDTIGPAVYLVNLDWAIPPVAGDTTPMIQWVAGFNAPKGICVCPLSPGERSAAFVIDALGIHIVNYPTPVEATGFVSHGAEIKDKITTVTTAYSILANDYLILCRHTAAVTITLPNNARTGQQYIIKDNSTSGAAMFPITINRNGGTIDGLSSDYVINLTRESVTLMCIGGGNTWITF